MGLDRRTKLQVWIPTRTDKSVCPLCGKQILDQLEHLRLTHDIESSLQFASALSRIQKNEARVAEFRKYIEELWRKKEKGLITAKDYRDMVEEWTRKHSKEES